jgi:ELWxxDGT repeat protein
LVGGPATKAAEVAGSPFYEFDLAAEVGSVMEGGVGLTDKPNLRQFDAPPIFNRFAIDDAGRLLFQAQLISGDPGKESVDVHYLLSRPDRVVLVPVDKPYGFYSGSLGLSGEGTIFTANRIFRGGNWTVPAGFVCEEVYNEFGDLKPCTDIVPGNGEVTRNGRVYFVGFDQNRFLARQKPWSGVYEVRGAGGGGSAVQLLRGLDDAAGSDPDIALGTVFIAPADNGRVAIGAFHADGRQIQVMQPDGTVHLLANDPAVASQLDYIVNPTMSLVPSITPDGEFVAWVRREGDLDSLMVAQGAKGRPFSNPRAVFTTTNVVALTKELEPIQFSQFSMEPVSILRHDVGNDGQIEGDTLWIAFRAVPKVPSRSNPHRQDVPLLFRDGEGIWALRVDIQRELFGTNLVLNANGVTPVVQVGDRFRGEEITGLSLWRSLGRGTADRLGEPRVPGKMDHVIAFRLETEAGPALVRAWHLDTDEDGLADHWERAGGGLDADRDGNVDLELARFGADPMHKDLFVEMDWLEPRRSGHPTGWRNDPTAETLNQLVDLYALAPLTNPDGIQGITLHVDAGPGRDRNGRLLSQNFPVDHQGGDHVTVGGVRPDILQIGDSEQGMVGPFLVAPLDVVKDRFFGTADRNAREFAFRYVVLGDFLGYDQQVKDPKWGPSAIQVMATAGQRVVCRLTGKVLPQSLAGVANARWFGFLDGPASGQLRRIVANSFVASTNADQTISFFRVDLDGAMPSPGAQAGNHVVFLGSGMTGIAESHFRSDVPGADPANSHRLPGNDVLASTASTSVAFAGMIQSVQLARLLAHELGHTLGLAHGGDDPYCQYRGDVHWSLMSYSHQSRIQAGSNVKIGGGGCEDPQKEIAPPAGLAPGAAVPGVVDSYSNGLDPLGFNEWRYARLETWSAPWLLGNSQMRYASQLPPLHPPGEPSPLEELASTRDAEPPRLEWLVPSAPMRVNPGTTWVVEFRATDNVAVTRVAARFDADGNGSESGAAEIVTPIALGGGRYRASFAVTGVNGPRTVRVEASDESGNVAGLEPKVMVGPGALPDTTAPSIELEFPNQGAALPPQGTVAVLFRTTDGSVAGGMLRAWVRFDVNGDGTVDDATETFAAVARESAFAGARVAYVPEASGTSGNRTLEIVSEDVWFNRAVRSVGISVTPPDRVLPGLEILSGPADGSPLDYGQASLRFRVRASDASGIQELSWAVDSNGDGILGGIGRFERLATFVGGATDVTQELSVTPTFSGPGGDRVILIEAVDRTGNRTVVTRTLQLRDTSPPVVWVTSPAAFWPVRTGGPLVVIGEARDNQLGSRVTVGFDVNGDGVVAAAERLTQTVGFNHQFTVQFPAIGGPAGARTLSVLAEDPAGLVGEQLVPLQVSAGLALLSPLAGDEWRIGSTHLCSLESPTMSSAAGSLVFRVRFDVDGDGVVSGAIEDQRVPAQVLQTDFLPAEHARAVAALGSIGGLPGVRLLRVEIEGEPGTVREVEIRVLESGGAGGVSQRLANLPLTASLQRVTGDASSLAKPVATLTNVVLFTAQTLREGLELWRSDGTPGGTYLLKDIDPGVFEGLGGQAQGSDPSGFVNYQGRVYFAATDQAAQTFAGTQGTGRELWMTDGTTAGTRLVRNIDTNRIPAQTTDSSSPADLLVFQDRLWFSASDGKTGRELWVSDGTEAGTTQFADLYPGRFGISPTRLRVAGNLLYFVADERALWRTDGTVAGTYRIYPEEEPDLSSPGWRDLRVAGNRLFLTRVAAGSYELWTSDGTTEGTIRLRVLAPFSSTFGQPEMAAAGERLVFSAESPESGRELWVSDGTVVGTQLLSDLWPGGPDSLGRVPSGQPRLFRSFGSRAVFTGLSSTVGEEPFVTDGTVAGTRAIGDLAPNAGGVVSSVPAGSSPSDYAPGLGALWFTAGDGNRRVGRELWRWDGAGQATLVRDLSPFWVTRPLGGFGQYVGAASAAPVSIVAGQDRVYFRATDPVYGDELHVSDGTGAGTRRVRNLSVGTTRPVLRARRDGSRLVASGHDGRMAQVQEWASGVGGARRWAAPAGGAAAFVNEVPGGWSFVTTNGIPGDRQRAWLHRWRDGASEPEVRLEARHVWQVAVGAGAVWVAGVDLDNLPALWRVPDSGAASRMVTLGRDPESTLFQTAEVGGRLVFTAGGVDTRELWVGDATGVRRLQPAAGTAPVLTDRFFVFGGRVYLQGATGGVMALWRTDGTDAGTEKFLDVAPLANRPVRELNPVILNGRMLFGATRFGVPHQLWITDGTQAGTVALGRVFDPIRGELFVSNIRYLTVAGDRAFFNGTTVYGEELWVTDGTVDGTRMVANIRPLVPGSFAEGGSDPTWITAIGRNVVFVAGTDAEGRELWFSDGTSAGTRPVKYLVPGVNSSDPADLTVLGGRVFFSAKTVGEGRELWATDGTPEGTAIVEDLWPGAASSDPTSLVAFGERLAYLAEGDGDDVSVRTVGATVSPYEAWLAGYVLPPGFPRDPSADGDGDGASNLLEFLYRTSPVDRTDKFGFTSVRSVAGVLPTLELTYLRPTDWRTRGMNFRLEFTERFGEWSVVFPSSTVVEPAAGGMERVTVRVQALIGTEAYFVRLRVSGG